MKFDARVICAVAIGLVTGCSSLDDARRAEGGFDYLEEPAPIELKLQEGKSLKRKSSSFDIAQIETAQPQVGRQIDIRSPAQILPLVDGSYIPEDSEEITIFFEVEGSADEDLKEDIWRVLWEYFYEKGIRAKFWDKQGGVLITDWFNVDEGATPTDLWGKLFDSTRISVTQRYLFTLEVPGGGRKAQLTALLLGHQEQEEGRITKDQLSDADKRRYTVSLLNGAVGHYEFSKRKLQAEEEQLKFRSVGIRLGEDANGLPAFIASAPFDRTWDRLALVLSEVGFRIDDRNKSLGTYYVTYGASESVWESLFGEDKLALPDESYEILVGDLKQESSITILRENSRSLSAETMAQIYDALEAAMQSDTLR